MTDINRAGLIYEGSPTFSSAHPLLSRYILAVNLHRLTRDAKWQVIAAERLALVEAASPRVS